MTGAQLQPRNTASLSLDLDNEWAYLMTHGNPAWTTHPTYLPVAVPRILGVLERIGLSITFFVVGQDAAMPVNHAAIGAIHAAGHEVGNHSYRHQPWLHRYTRAELHDELARTEDALAAITGTRPVGFRGPGYSLSPAVLDVLVARGYRYDASTLPTFIGPLSRAFYFRSAKLTDEQRKERALLFGSWADGTQPLRPYRFTTVGGPITELPVSTLPGLRIPIHVSYLLYLAAVSPRLATAYFAGALAACRARRIEPSILLHPLDFLGADDVSTLAFFPAMGLGGQRKTDLVEGFLHQLNARYEVVGMLEHVQRIESRGGLALRQPRRVASPS